MPRLQPDESWYIHKHRDTIHDYTDLPPSEKSFIFAWDAHVLPHRILSPVYLPRTWLGFIRKNAKWLAADPLLFEEVGKHLSSLVGRGLLEDDEVVRAGLEILDETRRGLENEKSGTSLAEPGHGKEGAMGEAGPGDAQPDTVGDKMDSAEANEDNSFTIPGTPVSRSGCGVCLRPLRGPSVVICSNDVSSANEEIQPALVACRAQIANEPSQDCKRRGYHDYCIRDKCVMDPEDEDWFCDACVHSHAASTMKIDSK